MWLHWRALYGQRSKNFLRDDGDEDNEIGLAAGDKQGSTSGKSKSSKKGGKGGKKTYKFKGKCGKVGHKAEDCWIKSENKDKRPEWYKVEEHGKVAKDSGETDGEGSVEIITCAVDLPPLIPRNMVWLDTDDEDEHNKFEDLADSVLDHEIVSDTDDEETEGE